MALMAMMFWGVSYIWTKLVLEYYQPITIMFIRLSISALLMYIYIRFNREAIKIARSDYKIFILLSFFSPFCYFIGETYGLIHVSPTVAAVIIATIPLFAPFLGYFKFKEKVSAVNLAGFLISFAGICFMVLDQGFRLVASPKGVFLLFFAVVVALVNLIYLKRLVTRYNPFTIIFVQNGIGALMFLPVFLWLELHAFLVIRPSATAIFSLIALAVFGSTLAFIFYTASVKSLGIAKTSVLGNLIPVFAAVASLIVLNETIDQGKITGMLLVISGLLLAQISAIQKKSKGVIS